ncbi:MAG: HlyD family efflux transporter periplasmic adaptor subunit [Planctomycetes bacterium]|nr:HlyD family efflux transporter periplasmic adaptor subunit [Planctomycetota bacterium]MBL7038269.1 HlyD family efflux transporter periplasmic adaptor subunit [Pirellulaceae bacterium]
MSNNRDSVQEMIRIIAPLVILAFGAGGFFLLKQKSEASKQAGEKKGAPEVDTAPVKLHEGALTIRNDGRVVPYVEVSLSAEVAGRIVSKADVCRAGRFVQKGQLLLQIDPGDYDREKRRLDKELEQAVASLEELEVQVASTQTLIKLAEDEFELQQNELDREQKLMARGATTDASVDQAKRGVLQARNSLLTLSNQLNLLTTSRTRLTSVRGVTQVRLEQAVEDLERTQITSPIDGMVVTESVQENSYVQRGTPLVTLEETSTVEVQCRLRMDELYWIWSQVAKQAAFADREEAMTDYQLPETPVTVVYRLSDEEYVWQGVLWRYDGIGVDERTRTVPCRVRVDSPRDVKLRTAAGFVEPTTGPPALVRGMFVGLEIRAKPKAKLLEVDEMAVQPGNKVYRIREGRLHTLDVQVVAIADGVAVLRAKDDSLRVDDKVVVTPLGDVTDGMTVKEGKPDQTATGAPEVTLATESETK